MESHFGIQITGTVLVAWFVGEGILVPKTGKTGGLLECDYQLLLKVLWQFFECFHVGSGHLFISEAPVLSVRFSLDSSETRLMHSLCCNVADCLWYHFSHLDHRIWLIQIVDQLLLHRLIVTVPISLSLSRSNFDSLFPFLCHFLFLIISFNWYIS